ncbi:hypothetical protein O6H91_16G083400 [Diphasiastrum complanatum]|uniref:Uncharacterized protein n=1 Tax=Diphasiastrum complanatum TaxID=34168 RepID=A0ACC2BEB4_DIPCM|nr:hypothetical protein O6H91_16G083400 [Diphasiastrum complanatum]
MICTRPDIAFAVSSLSQYMTNPGITHWKALIRVMRYLRATMDFCICYGAVGNDKLNLLMGYTDASWARDVDTRKSTSGFTFFLNNGPISWNSYKQSSIALSSTESEYIAASQATKEAIWLRNLLSDIGLNQYAPTILFCDNQSAIALSANPRFHSRSKHIELKYHFVISKVLNEKVRLQYCRTQDMTADVFTKALSLESHTRFCVELSLKVKAFKDSD